MNRLPVALCVLLLAAPSLVAGDEAPRKEQREPTMAERTAAARTNRRKSESKVITNDDVRRAKGTLVETSGKMDPVDPAPTQSSTERHEAAKHASAVAAARKAAGEARVKDLEKQLLAAEQSYYEESDLNRRDGELVRRFETLSRQLADARKELETLDGNPTP